MGFGRKTGSLCPLICEMCGFMEGPSDWTDAKRGGLGSKRKGLRGPVRTMGNWKPSAGSAFITVSVGCWPFAVTASVGCAFSVSSGGRAFLWCLRFLRRPALATGPSVGFASSAVPFAAADSAVSAEVFVVVGVSRGCVPSPRDPFQFNAGAQSRKNMLKSCTNAVLEVDPRRLTHYAFTK